MKIQGSEQRQQGSFGRPPEMDMHMQAQQEMKRSAKNEIDEKQVEEILTQAGDKESDSQENRLLELEKQAREEVALLEKHLGIEVTKDDIVHYVRKGRLKKQIDILEGEIAVTFQTLTAEDLDEIQDIMREFRSQKEHTSAQIENHQSLVNLSFGIVEYDGKNFSGAEKKAIIGSLKKLPALYLQKVVNYFNIFNRIVDHKLNDRKFLKKS